MCPPRGAYQPAASSALGSPCLAPRGILAGQDLSLRTWERDADGALGWRPVITGDRRQPQAALKWSWLISDFKCLQNYSKSSRHDGTQPGTKETSARLCWGIPHHLCFPPSPQRWGCVPPPAAPLAPYSSCKGLFAAAQSKPDFISRLQFPWLWATVDASHAGLVKPIRGPVHRAGCVHCHMTSCLQPAGAQGHHLPVASLPAQAMCVLPVAGQMDVQAAGGSRTSHGTMPAWRGLVAVSHCNLVSLASVSPLGSGEQIPY